MMSVTPVVPMTNWKETSVTVIGMGRSGLAAADLLLDRGSTVTLVEEQPRQDLEMVRAAYEQRGARVCFGGGFEDALSQADLLVVSPGVPKEHPFLAQASQRNIPVIGEIELASWFLKTPIIAVTGTNGKSTTVRLIGSILQESGKHVFVGGNLGIPLCEAVPKSTDAASVREYDYIVAEVSSFQLETIQQFKPWIAALLNVSTDHLDRHPTQEEYQNAKRRIFENQTRQDWMIINADDPIVRDMARNAQAGRCEFSLGQEVPQGMYWDGAVIRGRLEGREEILFERDDIPMRGKHNLANAMVAMTVGLLCGCSQEQIVKALGRTPTFEHALEPVRTWNGVTFVNDSKGTNVDATLKALQSFDESIVLILGGKDKGGDFTRLLEGTPQGLKGIILIGEAAPRIFKELEGSVPMTRATSLDDAVSQAVALAS
ncbi:MAG: UDP-N-acetylmuramoyl-L-alanine--D-glutamate ligase, partial [Nitrospirota bacterium]|nr:UDP-N-acetylmuramoyl-L-alanine--D-glutamate ligase [Nitrospirota bacterium]